MKLEKEHVINKIIKHRKLKYYLEIGVWTGSCLFKIKSRKKIAVDPDLRISLKAKLLYYTINPLNIFNKYFEMTSDNFFNIKPKFLIKNGLDIVLIDGLHTYEQSLKDFQNCFKYLNDDGVIIFHDCNPQSESEAIPRNNIKNSHNFNPQLLSKDWCGDVWKTIVHLRSLTDDLSIFTLDCDFGLAIVSRGSQFNKLDFSLEEIKKLTYKDLEKNREKFLNLKPPDYFKDFINLN
ncbi:MAG: class I SAM-dependent methyltransferase [Promethearchaeota archaeon]